MMMNIEELRAYCLAKEGVEESFPFDETTLVFKVGGKIIALTDTVDTLSVNLKCDPEKSVELRERYDWIIPGYHMNKKHWITLQLDSFPDTALVLSLIDHSYDLVVNSLPKQIRVKSGRL
jgi:predicted DNA-binding protein (MmcQ/YjbR family)